MITRTVPLRNQTPTPQGLPGTISPGSLMSSTPEKPSCAPRSGSASATKAFPHSTDAPDEKSHPAAALLQGHRQLLGAEGPAPGPGTLS